MKLSNVIMVVSVIVSILSWAYVLFCQPPSKSTAPSGVAQKVSPDDVLLFSHSSYGNVVFVYDPAISKDKIFAKVPNGDEYFEGVSRDKAGEPSFQCPTTVNGEVEFSATIAKYNTEVLRWECDAKFAPVSLEG